MYVLAALVTCLHGRLDCNFRKAGRSAGDEMAGWERLPLAVACFCVRGRQTEMGTVRGRVSLPWWCPPAAAAHSLHHSACFCACVRARPTVSEPLQRLGPVRARLNATVGAHRVIAGRRCAPSGGWLLVAPPWAPCTASLARTFPPQLVIRSFRAMQCSTATRAGSVAPAGAAAARRPSRKMSACRPAGFAGEEGRGRRRLLG